MPKVGFLKVGLLKFDVPLLYIDELQIALSPLVAKRTKPSSQNSKIFSWKQVAQSQAQQALPQIMVNREGKFAGSWA